MKLQYEILSIGLKESMIAIAQQQSAKNLSYKNSLYYNFSSYYVDDKDNLKDIMEQLVQVADEEVRIKEELFLLLSFFILTWEHRNDKIQQLICRNKQNFLMLVQDFYDTVEDEDTQSLMMALKQKLEKLE